MKALILAMVIALAAQGAAEDGDYIKWIDFNIPLAVLKQAYKYDVESQNSDMPLDFVQLLAYTSAKNWGTFKGSGESADMSALVKRLRAGERIGEITADMKLYDHYLRAYGAVLGSFVGHYEKDGEIHYGLRVFSPIAKGFGYGHSDDFGNPRNYGYKRSHLGHDMFGSIGTPIIAVEDGIVEALGWNQYGGWRVGIRSLDRKRYYYYAHLRKDKPYAEGLEEGARVRAGDVIGFLGNTGYSTRENVANLKQPHLHFGLQIIFDESQKDGNNQIWIDTYALIKFLEKNRMPVERPQGGAYRRGVETCSFPME
ncbi:MAG: M23 family metallopeptidase [Clostridiales bacterium]|jgi:murein DD-endopeptidase MepM/ murein hydrolase activator NlpD|nr:M23 family metallopeptidase [Clostridiales bacterium]